MGRFGAQKNRGFLCWFRLFISILVLFGFITVSLVNFYLFGFIRLALFAWKTCWSVGVWQFWGVFFEVFKGCLEFLCWVLLETLAIFMAFVSSNVATQKKKTETKLLGVQEHSFSVHIDLGSTGSRLDPRGAAAWSRFPKPSYGRDLTYHGYKSTMYA